MMRKTTPSTTRAAMTLRIMTMVVCTTMVLLSQSVTAANADQSMLRRKRDMITIELVDAGHLGSNTKNGRHNDATRHLREELTEQQQRWRRQQQRRLKTKGDGEKMMKEKGDGDYKDKKVKKKKSKKEGEGKKKMGKKGAEKSGKEKGSKAGKGDEMGKKNKKMGDKGGKEMQRPIDPCADNPFLIACMAADMSMATSAPVTPAPVTPAPVTPAPVTVAPVTAAPNTAAPNTAAPTDTCLTGTTETAYLTNLLSTYTDPAILSDPTTSQGMALDWLANTDTVDVCSYPSVEARYAVLTLYFATGGASWTTNTAWLTPGSSECGWFGIVCDASGALTELNLAVNNLVGTVPPEVTMILTDLIKIDVYRNSLTGPIPDISTLASLELADFEENTFSGPAFTAIPGASTALTSYRVSRNALTGTIPTAIGLLTNLSELWFANNLVTGTIPLEIGQLTALSTAIWHQNMLTGSLPTTMNMLTSLGSLFVHTNQLVGTIPSRIFDFPGLTELRLEKNQLQGTIPSGTGARGLTQLWLNNNDLSGTIPQFFTETTMLRNFLIGNNTLTGRIPAMGSSSLFFFDIRYNQLTGPIPPSLFTDPAVLEFAYLQGNMLTGTVPATFSQASSLVDFYVSENMLVGTIPGIPAGSLPNLNELLFQQNLFVGSMPDSICALRSGNLEDLWVDCAPPPEVTCALPDCCTRCFPQP